MNVRELRDLLKDVPDDTLVLTGKDMNTLIEVMVRRVKVGKGPSNWVKGEEMIFEDINTNLPDHVNKADYTLGLPAIIIEADFDVFRQNHVHRRG